MELRELTQRVSALLHEAGKHVLQQQLTPHDYEDRRQRQTHQQYVAQIDTRLVDFLHDKINEIEPYQGFWSSDTVLQPSRHYWCVGHIDGTINYRRNLSEWTLTISLLETDENADITPILGIVHAPALGLEYLAARGQGAIRIRRTPQGHIQRSEVKPSMQATLHGSVVSFGMSYFQEESKRALSMLYAMSGLPADIKRIGPASLDICKVADGTYDAFFEPSLHAWDMPAMSAAAVIAQESHVPLATWSGEPIAWGSSNDIVVSNGMLCEELYSYLHASCSR